MHRFLPRSLFTQLLLSTVLVQTVFLGLFIWYTVISQRRGSEERARQRVERQLDRLAAECSIDLADSNMPLLQRALELSRLSPTIEVARVTDLSGKTLAVTENSRSHGLDSFESAALRDASQRQIFAIRNGQLEAVTPILVQGQPAALLWLEPSRTLGLNATQLVVQIAMSYGGFALLANILPIFLIVRTMTQPLSILKKATDRVVRDPELTTGFPLPVTTSNEAGALTSSFNSMVQELQEQRRDLLETLALLDSMLRNAPIGFAFFDRELRYVRVNEFLADLHGFPIELHLGKRPTEVYPASVGEPKLAFLQQVFESGTAIRNVQLSGEMPHAPGMQRSWMMHFYPVLTAQNVMNWVGVIVVEITDQLRAEEALRKTEKLAATGRLAASIAHEINNPLESVTNILYLLETHDALDGTAADYVATAQAELARVSEITQQTLRFYRQSTSPTLVSVSEILNSILRLYQTRIRGFSVSVITSFHGDPEIFGLGGELRQLFANLVGNALDAMPSGGTLRLTARCAHGRHLDGTWSPGVRVFITDSGVGMSEETRRRIFEPFFTTKEATGTGLGLWISQEIVRKHYGSLHVRSRQCPNSVQNSVQDGVHTSGTSFMVFLPSSTPRTHATESSTEADFVQQADLPAVG